MTKTIDALVIAAHPDDAEFGVAGTVARWTQAGRNVVYVVCTSGDKGTSDRSLASEQLVKIREEEQRKAALLLGVERVVFLRYLDQSLEDTPEFRKEIVRQIRIFRPDIVATSDPYRRYIWHRDHRIVGQVVLDAVYPYARDHLAYPDLLDQELHPHKVREVWFWGADEINHRMDITETFENKLAALHCHASQIKEFQQPDLEKWLRRRCREMAADQPFQLAEGFQRVVAPG